jgi:hypothetical protein
MTKWFKAGTEVQGISMFAGTFGRKGIIVRGRNNNGLYIVRWNDGIIEGVTINDIASLRFKG